MTLPYNSHYNKSGNYTLEYYAVMIRKSLFFFFFKDMTCKDLHGMLFAEKKKAAKQCEQCDPMYAKVSLHLITHVNV